MGALSSARGSGLGRVMDRTGGHNREEQEDAAHPPLWKAALISGGSLGPTEGTSLAAPVTPVQAHHSVQRPVEGRDGSCGLSVPGAHVMAVLRDTVRRAPSLPGRGLSF